MGLNLLQQVARQAHRTFGVAIDATEKQNRFAALKGLVNQVTAQNVFFRDEWVPQPDGGPDGSHAPVMYIMLYEHRDSFSMGLFVLGQNVTLPLHDHPQMSGLIKVLRGTARITSYTAVAGDAGNIPASVLEYLRKESEGLVDPAFHHIKKVEELEPKIVNFDTGLCSLTAEEGNFHEIKSVDGPMAFLDILAPPYDHDGNQRVCNYYKELLLPAALVQDGMKFLISTMQPSYFWCEQSKYDGPKLNDEIVTGEMQDADNGEQ